MTGRDVQAMNFFLVPRSRYIMQQAHGRSLDLIALKFGVTRKRWWWLFREWDSSLRRRTIEVATDNRPKERALAVKRAEGVDIDTKTW